MLRRNRCPSRTRNLSIIEGVGIIGMNVISTSGNATVTNGTQTDLPQGTIG